MELSRKEKFGTKKTTRKWPKVILATTFALTIGSTSAFAAKPELADYLYNQVIAFAFKTEMQDELKAEKETLLTGLSVKVGTIFSDTKEDLKDKKDQIIEEKKTDLQEHYNNEIAKIEAKKEQAVEKKTQEMNTEAANLFEKYKAEITKEIEKEVKKNKINN